EGRVTMSQTRPTTAFPSPYLLEVPSSVGLQATSVSRLVTILHKGRYGQVRVPFVGIERREEIRITRTAAHTRALRHVTEDESLTHAIDRVWGTWALDPLKLRLVDLTEVALPEQVGLRRQTERDVERIARLRLTNARLRARL